MRLFKTQIKLKLRDRYMWCVLGGLIFEVHFMGQLLLTHLRFLCKQLILLLGASYLKSAVRPCGVGICGSCER